jgi:hypothetical protein
MGWGYYAVGYRPSAIEGLSCSQEICSDYPSCSRKKDGYFVFSDIFKFICDDYDDQYHGADDNCVENIPQVDAPYTMAETGISFQHY